MSEYQYYEFRTIDQPLTPAQMKEVRALSSRAEITSRSFTNTYNYGDFGGNPRKLMERYYDAHVYVSNFGTVTFMLRLPQTVLPEETLAQYATEEVLEWWTTDTHTILEWQWNEDGGSDGMDGEGWLDRLLPLRDELVRGDYRSLYLGWLSSVVGAPPEEEDDEEEEETDDAEKDDDETDDEEDDIYSLQRKEPPVPAGLHSLTEAQSALTEFLSVSDDLITAAAAVSPKVFETANSPEKRAEWVAQLSEKEVRFVVERILGGDGSLVQTDLQSRYYRSLGESGKNPDANSDKRRTAGELLTIAAQAEIERKQHEAKKREQKRQAHLKGLIPRLPELWTTVNDLAEAQTAASYDKVRTQLVDMRDAYAQADRSPEFDTAFALFLKKYSRSTALVRRLKAAGLMS